jgi:hypothetical protein
VYKQNLHGLGNCSGAHFHCSFAGNSAGTECGVYVSDVTSTPASRGHLATQPAQPFCWMEADPGVEAHVDFDQGASVSGYACRRCAHQFRMCSCIRARLTAMWRGG